MRGLDAVAGRPRFLKALTRASDEVLTGTLGDALGELEVGGTVDEALGGGLEEVRGTLQGILDRAGGQAGAEGGGSGTALPGGRSSPAGEPSSDAPRRRARQEIATGMGLRPDRGYVARRSTHPPGV